MGREQDLQVCGCGPLQEVLTPRGVQGSAGGAAAQLSTDQDEKDKKVSQTGDLLTPSN